MKTEFLVVSFFLTISFNTNILTLFLPNPNQVFATLLEENTLQDQNRLGSLLFQNSTDGNQQAQQQPETGSENGIEAIPKSQSDIIMQDLKNTSLVDRIFPLILKKLQTHITAVEKTIEIPAIFTNGRTFNIGCPNNGAVIGGGYVLDDTSFLGIRESAPHLDPQNNVVEWTVTVYSQGLVMNDIAGSDIRGPDYAKVLAPLKIYAICLELGTSAGEEKPIKLN